MGFCPHRSCIKIQALVSKLRLKSCTILVQFSDDLVESLEGRESQIGSEVEDGAKASKKVCFENRSHCLETFPVFLTMFLLFHETFLSSRLVYIISNESAKSQLHSLRLNIINYFGGQKLKKLSSET